MKSGVCSFLVWPLLIAAVASETAFYVPKSFYVIDHNGAASEPVLLLGSPSILRSRRSPVPSSISTSSSSSSSSSSGGFGGQTFSVSSSSSNTGFGNPYGPVYHPAYVPAPQPQYIGATLHNRFADDGSVSGIGLTGSSHGSGGVFSGSSSTVGSDGKVHFSTHTGKFRK